MPNAPARRPPPPLTPDEQLAWRALVHAINVINRVLDRDLLQAQGLSLSEYAVLTTLSEQPDQSMRMGGLANEVWVSEPEGAVSEVPAGSTGPIVRVHQHPMLGQRP